MQRKKSTNSCVTDPARFAAAIEMLLAGVPDSPSSSPGGAGLPGSWPLPCGDGEH